MLPLTLLVAVSSLQPGVDLPPVRRGEVTARAEVRVAERGVGPARARARFTLTVEGPVTLEVEGPRLEDALAAWRVVVLASSWSAKAEKATWEITLNLAQLKPGAAPLPGLRLRVRARPGDEWQDVSWLDPLHEPRDVAPIVELPPLPPSAWRGYAIVITIIAIPLLAIAALVWHVRRRETSAPPEPAWRRAVARIGDDVGIEQVTTVLRDFLYEQSGLPAGRRTTAELLVALESRGDVPAGALVEIRRLLHLGDLVKFAGHPLPDPEAASARQRGRGVIEALATWPAGENGRIGEGG